MSFSVTRRPAVVFALSLCVLLVLAFLTTVGIRNSHASKGEDVRPYYPYVMRLTGEIEFDGTVVPINEVVACKMHRPETAQGFGAGIPVPDYQPIVKMSDGRGWIDLQPGNNICRLYANIWAPENPDLPQITPPEGYVPGIRFIEHRPKTDFRTDPTVPGDGIYETVNFNSYRAINNPHNRLTITQPFNIALEPFPPSEALLAEVEAQKATIEAFKHRPVQLQVNRPEGGTRFDTDPPNYFSQGNPWVKIIPEEIWRDPLNDPYFSVQETMIRNNYDTQLLGRVVDRMTDLPEDAIVALDMAVINAEPLLKGKKWGPVGLLPHNRQKAGTLVYGGIPQPGLERKGVLYSEKHARSVRNFSEADRIPFRCKNGVFEPAFELQGQSFSVFPACPFEGMNFKVPGRKVIHRPFEYRGGLYLYLDTRTMELWYVVFNG